MAYSNANPVSAMQGSPAVPTLQGTNPARIPTGGKIRAGIKVLTKKAASEPKAKAIYEQGVAAGQSFDQIERAIAEALPDLKTPLVPRNVSWFTVRAQDFPNPEIAGQILEAYGEDRGERWRLYRFPVLFPSDFWQTVMPHELAAWGTHDKRYWSQYSADGRSCLIRAVALYLAQHTGRYYGALFSDEADGPSDPERKRMFMAMKREVLRMGGYRQEFFVSQTPELNAMADAVIDQEAYLEPPPKAVAMV